MVYEDKESNQSLSLRSLLERAEFQGFITSEDIQELYPALNSKDGQLSRLIALLVSQGIEVTRSEEFMEPPGARLRSSPKAKLASETLSNDDSVSIYMHEMSLTPLLNMEEERSLATRIDRSDIARDELGPSERS